jgi:hypothetical protein
MKKNEREILHKVCQGIGGPVVPSLNTQVEDAGNVGKFSPTVGIGLGKLSERLKKPIMPKNP